MWVRQMARMGWQHKVIIVREQVPRLIAQYQDPLAMWKLVLNNGLHGVWTITKNRWYYVRFPSYIILLIQPPNISHKKYVSLKSWPWLRSPIFTWDIISFEELSQSKLYLLYIYRAVYLCVEFLVYRVTPSLNDHSIRSCQILRKLPMWYSLMHLVSYISLKRPGK